jgi:hypothetical protein
VSDGSTPVTFVEAWTISKQTASTKNNLHRILTIRKALGNNFITVQPQDYTGLGFLINGVL